MKGSIVAVIVGLLVLVGIGAVVLSSDDSSEDSTAATSSPSSNNSLTAEQAQDRVDVPEPTNGPQGLYTDYSEANLASAAGKNKVVFFHASWCIVCKNVENNIKAGSIPEDLVILEADFDEDEALRKQYEVTQQTSFVQIDDQGNLIKKWVQFDSSSGINEILAQIESA